MQAMWEDIACRPVRYGRLLRACYWPAGTVLCPGPRSCSTSAARIPATGGTQSTGPGSPGGTPVQSTGSQYAPPPPVTGLGWEIFVRSYADYTTLLCQVPPSVYTTFQAVAMLNDIGSGSVTLNMDAPWWKNTAMGDGSTANTILDFECLWQIALDGVVRIRVPGRDHHRAAGGSFRAAPGHRHRARHRRHAEMGARPCHRGSRRLC